MSDATGARELLYGVLGLHVGLVPDGALVRALDAWSRDRSRPLAEYLREQGALSTERQKLLEALLVEHLKQHSDDVSESLASLGSNVGLMSTLDAAGLEELRAATDGLLRSSGVSPGKAREAARRRGPSRFRIIRPHAKGGRGEVFLARDEELDRQVAVKEIQRRYADEPEARARFVAEAEITGGLEHPGIVPVYGLGYYDDGRPYYAMRFVRGDSLKAAVERFHEERAAGDPSARPLAHDLEFRKLLGRFVDVCNAVDYAHSRGVLHRDLKPGNVMLGRYGETLVVDWGLAKPLAGMETHEASVERLRPSSGSGSSGTEAGTVLGTPAYMSPEQAKGRLDELGVASDVYSLGATLYTVLTGRAPFAEAPAEERLALIQRGGFRGPRQIDPSVPRALEAVCLKAMALAPKDRHASCGELAEDVEHWLADEPVGAWREPWTLRGQRWVRRHRVALQAAAIAGTLLLAGLAVANQRLVVANAREREARAQAQRQRERAEENYRLARQTVDDLMGALRESPLLGRREMRAVRKDLAGVAIKYYRKFLAEGGSDARLVDQAAWAHYYVADVTARINLDPDAAAAEYASALALFEKALAQDPDAASVKLGLARTLIEKGWLSYRMQGRPEEAEPSFERARSLSEDLARQEPTSPEPAAMLARSHASLAQLYVGIGERDKAEASLSKALEVQEALVRDHPAEAAHRKSLGTQLNQAATFQQSKGDTARARALYERALATGLSLSKEDPSNEYYMFDVASAHHNLGRMLYYAGEMEEAESQLTACLRLAEALDQRYPGILDYESLIGTAAVNLAKLYRDTGRASKAEGAYRRAAAVFRKLRQEDSGAEADFFSAALARVYEGMGRLKRDASPEEALLWYGRALALIEPLLRRNPRNQQAKGYLRETLEGRAEALTRLARYREALSDWDRLLASDGSVALRLRRARTLALAGDAAGAAREAEAAAAAEGSGAGDWLAAARVLALARDPEGSATDGHGPRALELLERAAHAGLFEKPERRDELLADADFDTLRAEPRFRAIAGAASPKP